MVDYDRSQGFLAQVNKLNSPTSSYMSHHRQSPHLSHLEHPASAPATPSPPYPPYAQPNMANMSQQNPVQPRQPTSYPSPHSYPSPSMSAYAYPPPQPQQTVEPYRNSPTGSHVSLPSLNLPPIRSIDPRNPQPGQVPMGSPLPPPVAPGMYYQQSLPPPGHAMNITSSPHGQMRYPLPQPDGRIMSGGRHKKEIKRRTKTGCLTCRKRRIKCDEAHPTCRNCQKSKRDCLGYDPIFKSQPSPAAIQPAPSSNPGMMHGGPSGHNQMPYPHMSHGYPTAVTTGYAPALSATGSSPASSVEPYDYSAAIDPALEAAGPTQMAMPPNPYDASHGYRPDLKRGLDSTSPYSSTASDTHNQRGGATPPDTVFISPEPSLPTSGLLGTSSAHTSFPAKRIKIDDLLAVGGVVPPPLTPPTEGRLPISPDALDEMKRLFCAHYAPAIDEFLETRWFTGKGLAWLLRDQRLLDIFAVLLERLRVGYSPDQHQAYLLTQAVEARVIWSMMCLCRAAAAAAASGQVEPEREKGLEEARRRLLVIEDLLSGAVADANHTEVVPWPQQTQELVKGRELEFWGQLGKFLTLRDDEASAAKEIDDSLAACRATLDGRENRDVIYSIAIARHVGQRVAEFPNQLSEPTNNDEEDTRNKLLVAKAFIESEAAGRATTQVIQRICTMAIRSWTVPVAQ